MHGLILGANVVGEGHGESVVHSSEKKSSSPGEATTCLLNGMVSATANMWLQVSLGVSRINLNVLLGGPEVLQTLSSLLPLKNAPHEGKVQTVH